MDIEISGGLQNNSLQIGDQLYYVPENTVSTVVDQNLSSSSPILIGTVTGIDNDGIIQVDNPAVASLSNDDFIMFQKNKAANNTSLIGYFAEVKLKNNSKEKAELFALSSEVIASSK
jgi:hypothetical protein